MELLSDGPFDLNELQQLRERIPELIRFGTSSWNYPEGWRGLVYHRKYPKSGAVTKMLAEYAEFPLFDIVGIDASFYRPLSVRTYHDYASVLPRGFLCIQKVWSRITIHTFTGHQDGGLAGQRNPDFLNAELCINEVIGPALEHFHDHLAPFVLEFQAIAQSERMTGLGFAERLDAFLGRLPKEAEYAVEVRNPEFLVSPYFATLREHGAAHVLSSWTRMPPLGEQLALPDAVTGPFLLTRALNRPGRTFDDAVKAFEPYDRIQDENPELRRDLCLAAERAIRLRIPIYLLIGNRAEGSSPHTVVAVARMIREMLDSKT